MMLRIKLSTNTCTCVCVSGGGGGGKKCSFLGKFGVLCFLVTSILRFALLHYYRRYVADVQMTDNLLNYNVTQPAFTCSKLTIETLEQGVKYVQS